MKLSFEEITSKILAFDKISKNLAFNLSNKILELEPIILEMNKENTFNLYENVSDSNIVTKYHHHYNLIDFNFNEVNIIIKKIQKLVLEISGKKEFYIKMWANIYRNGDYIKYHKHLKDWYNDENVLNSYLSGHCFLYSSEPTVTTYYFNGNKKNILGGTVGTELENIPGEILLFSSCLPHEFKKWNGKLRIGIAFDLIIDTSIPIEINPYKHFKLIK